MKTIIRVALVAGVALAALTPAIASHSWSTYHWASNGGGVPLTVKTAITSQWTSSIGQAILDWDTSNFLSLTAAPANGVNTRKCNPIAGQILICNDSYGQRGWLGIASVWTTNGHISQATTKLNDTYFNSAQYNKPEWRALVACQEIGHDFGLNHQDEAFGNANLGTCMDYTNQPLGGGVYGNLQNIAPNQHDYDQLQTIYNHGDPGVAAATNFAVRQVGRPVPQSGDSSLGAGDGPAEWGRAIHRDGKGRPDLFQKDLAPGRKVFTHVFWAIGEGPGASQ